LRPALKATINKQWEQTNEEMTMTATGNNDNVGGEGCNNNNDNSWGLTSTNNKQQST
jgi:hypothetical protein